MAELTEKQLEANKDLLEQVSKVDTSLPLADCVTTLLRSDSMQEFVEAPNSRELAMIANQALASLNNVNPVTEVTIAKVMQCKSLYALLVKLVMIEFIKIIIADYTHQGVPDSSIEDIPVQDRQPRYENFLALLKEEKTLQEVANRKKALGIGTDVEAGKAMGKVRVNPHLNDFNGISRF